MRTARPGNDELVLVGFAGPWRFQMAVRFSEPVPWLESVLDQADASVLPVLVAGLLVANPLAKRSAKARIRPVALTLATIAATVLLYKQIFLVG